MATPASNPRSHYAENPSAFPLEGGCACGQVRYRLERPPLIVHCCHCTVCQRETGSGFGLNAQIEADAVTGLPSAPPNAPSYPARPDEYPACGPLPERVDRRVTSSNEGASDPQTNEAAPESHAEVVEPVLMSLPSESGYGQEVARCPACGTMVWSHYAGTGRLVRFIRTGTLDRAWEINPDVYIYTRSKRDFVSLPEDGRPKYDEFYPSKEAVWREGSLQRLEKLLPAINEYRLARGFRAMVL
ncbi:hypothetical protein GQ53DRAFT_747281 [Thozetella sp. PMI_491]|nr:hypothetical protein GQ53DRAFT_747281 [Thozetella sp. PMI_491]